MRASGSIRWGGVGIGALVALLASLLLSPAVRALYGVLTGSRVTPEFAGLVTVSLLAGFLAYLLGGYVAGRIARSARGTNGAMTAVLGSVVGAAMGSLGVAPSGGVWAATMDLGASGLELAIVAVLFLAELFGGYVGGKLGEPPGSAARRPDE